MASREVTKLRGQLRREQIARRHRSQINELAAQTSGEVSRRGVSEVIAAGATAIFDAGWVLVAYVDDDDTIQIVHGPGVPQIVVDDWQTAPLDLSIPIADVLRGELDRVALESPADFAPWPIIVAGAERADIGCLFIEPVPGEGRAHAVVALTWPEPRCLDDDERELLDELVAAATPAFERAKLSEVDRELVNSLQKWLLPSALPDVEGLDLATMYEAGLESLEVGGDWYDVVALADECSAIIIGDVVGHDVRAAAEMGQVRHVIAAHLMATGNAAESLHLSDQYFHRRASNTMATALVMFYDRASNTLHLTSAGHLPPVVARPGRPSMVATCGLGPPIGSGLGGYRSTQVELGADTLVVAVTDGVVELRDETIDASMTALCSALDEHLAHGHPGVDAVIDMLRARVSDSDRNDDAAAIVFRTL